MLTIHILMPYNFNRHDIKRWKKEFRHDNISAVKGLSNAIKVNNEIVTFAVAKVTPDPYYEDIYIFIRSDNGGLDLVRYRPIAHFLQTIEKPGIIEAFFNRQPSAQAQILNPGRA